MRYKKNRSQTYIYTLKRENLVLISLILLSLLWCSNSFSQSSLQGQIHQTINDLVRLLNVVIVGFAAWAGFLIAKGDGSGQARLIYAVIGLIVVNSSNMIVNYFL